MLRYFVLILPFFTLHGLIPLLTGIFPAYYGWQAYAEDRNLREQGQLVEAHIIQKQKSGATYHIKYSYIDTTGAEFKAERDLGQEYNEMVNTNDYFLITYLPSNPNVHMLGDKSSLNSRGTLAIVLLSVALVLCGWGTWGISRTIWQTMEVRFLFRKGKTGTAVVGDWIPSPGKSRNVTDQMTFHFVAANGRWYEGRSRSFGVRIRKQWPKGKHIKVAYDPIKPVRCEPDVFELLK